MPEPMSYEEAEEIIERYEFWEYKSCSCHVNPPCARCVEMPDEETYIEALKVFDNLSQDADQEMIGDDAFFFDEDIGNK